MSITIDEIKITEQIIEEYFHNVKVLNVWKTSVRNRREYKERLEMRIQSGIFVQFTDNIKSPLLSHAIPSNRQPPKGIDACIDKAGEVYENLLIELSMVELDIIATEEGIEKLEQKTMLFSEVIKTMNGESKKIIELKLGEDKSYEDIGYILKKSKSAVHNFYRRTIKDICKWLKYMNALRK